jgi:hypothetical protein
MIDVRPGTLFGTIFAGAATLLAEVVPALGAVEKMVGTLGGVAILIWLIIRLADRIEKEREKCDQKISDLQAEVAALKTQKTEVK